MLMMLTIHTPGQIYFLDRSISFLDRLTFGTSAKCIHKQIPRSSWSQQEYEINTSTNSSKGNSNSSNSKGNTNEKTNGKQQPTTTTAATTTT